jgi:hypothetical protein
VADDFAERYGDLLTGTCDCVDRIVLNAYYPLGHNPGGFRVWWRRWHGDSDAELDDAHLMRLAGRFARRVRAWAAANGVPVIDCKAGERKHRIAEEYLASHSVGPGVFMILVARAPATVRKVRRSPAGVIMNLEKKTEYVNHYSFHIMDPACSSWSCSGVQAMPLMAMATFPRALPGAIATAIRSAQASRSCVAACTASAVPII